MSRRAASRAAAFLIFTGLAATNGPSPLYPIYQQEYHLSAFVLTATFCSYQVGVLLTLLAVGSLSDRIGRKPVLVAASAVLVLSVGVYGAVQGTAWILTARFLQGVALGNIGSAATAALVEADPDGDRARASRLSTLAFSSGAGSGSLMFGFFAQYLPWPTRLPFVAVGIAALVGVALALRLPETLETAALADGSPWRRLAGSVKIQRPVVPRAIRLPLAASFCTVGVAWSVSGIYAALSPSMVVQLLHDSNHVVASCVLLVFWVFAGVGQLLSRGRSSRFAMVAGLLSTAAGIVLLQFGVMDDSGAAFGVGAGLSGLGFGTAFVGSLALANEVAPAHQRAEIVSTYNIAGYTAVAVPIVGVGALASWIGLTDASGVFALVVIGVTLATFAVLARLPEAALAAASEFA